MQDIPIDPVHRKFYRFFFWGILAISIAVRLPFISVERLWPDEALYAWYAKQIVLHPGMMFSREVCEFHPPLFSILLSLFHLVLPAKQACHGMAFLTGILGIIFIYLLGRKIQGVFLGCFAAMMLGFNLLYFTLSNYILIDVALTVLTIVFFYLLTGVSSKAVTSRDYAVGFAAAGLILLKWSGGLVLPFLVIYYALAFPDLTLRERLKKVAIPLMIGAAVTAILLVHNVAVTGRLIPKVFTDHPEVFRAPVWFYTGLLLKYFLEWPIVPFFLLGLWYTARHGNRDHWAHALWVVLSLVIISLMSNKDMRFLLPLMPGVMLIAGITINAVLSKLEEKTTVEIFKPLFLVLMFAFLLNVTYAKGRSDTVLNTRTFIGYTDAGQYIKEEAAGSPETIILAGSPRMIRYYTDIDFKEYGGRISPIPADEEGLRQLLLSTSSPVIVEVDAWEKLQPKWVFPMDEEKIGLLKAFGFDLEKVVRRDMSDSKEGANRDVVWVFRREARNP